MNPQIYLLLVRQSGSWDDFKDATLMKVPMILKQVLKDMVMGDSLDVPFIKFIRCENVSHGLSFGGLDSSSKQVRKRIAKGQFETETVDTSTDTAETGGNKFRGYGSGVMGYSATTEWAGPNTSANDYDFEEGKNSWLGGNQFIKNRVPSHDEVTFTKSIDTATPQLAYGCAAQEQYPLAAFFYRRKAGLGIAGVRWPYFVMGLAKCKIKEWSLDGDSETVKLSYTTISWCGYDQWADTNISYPWSTRWFDQEASKGGQGGYAALIQALAAGLIMGAAAITAAATAGDG